jgi:dGTP triphosphohydrolase
MNTLSFRKLAGKTQVILSLAGPDVRTRLTHTIEVSRIAKEICSRLDLNADLAEAIALAHDIGHTPFGHVGERTLREIMCGCNTLGGKISDCDFANSGFKHNLQSFRVLTDLEQICTKNDIWSPILWGALNHTNMTWSKSYSGIDYEILISSSHCNWVHVCYYDEKKECKRNIQKKKSKIIASENNSICKPWYCANLPIVDNKDDVTENVLYNGETTQDYLKKEPIRREFVEKIYCSHQCYMAKLWKYKQANFKSYRQYHYLYDHPFPNSFYAGGVHDFFANKINGKNSKSDYVTVEAQIVCQADEIAQRQQDLEDGISKGLLSFSDTKEHIRKLLKIFDSENQKIKKLSKELTEIVKPDKLGKLLVDFYIELIVAGSMKYFAYFGKEINPQLINIYSLLNILYYMSDNLSHKSKWLIEELKSPVLNNTEKKHLTNKIIGSRVFRPNYDIGYLYLTIYDHLENQIKIYGYSKNLSKILCLFISHVKINKKRAKAKNKLESIEKNIKDIISSELYISKIKKIISRLMKIKPSDSNKLSCKDIACDYVKSSSSILNYHFILALDNMRDYLKNAYTKESKVFFQNKDKTPWKNLGTLNLPQFYTLSKIHKKCFIGENTIICARDLTKFAYGNDGYKTRQAFLRWKEILGNDGHKVLNNYVQFVFKNDEKQAKIDDFKEKQKNTILKSESVEKNDGKAGYILTRLFKAYISNSHQLPDMGLKMIFNTLQNEKICDKLKQKENEKFEDILSNLKKTLPESSQTNEKMAKIKSAKFMKITKDEFDDLKENVSSEIKAALDNRWKLYEFIRQMKKDKSKLQKYLNSDKDKDIGSLNEYLGKFRAILDNPFLNPTPFWKSILTRGICDYIAGLTDQEAINEYEKLYAGIMELV